MKASCRLAVGCSFSYWVAALRASSGVIVVNVLVVVLRFFFVFYTPDKEVFGCIMLGMKDNSFHRHCKALEKAEASMRLRPDNPWWYKAFIAIAKASIFKDPYYSI